jgi:hypothetical protein
MEPLKLALVSTMCPHCRFLGKYGQLYVEIRCGAR